MEASYLPPFKAEGKLEETPLPVLIAYILDEKLTGNLHLETEEQKAWIHFEEGFPAGVNAPKSQDFLGSVLREMGLIDDASFNDSLMAMAKNKQLQGQILLDMGKIDEEQLEKALSFQLARKLARLFVIKKGAYRFVEYEELPPPMDPIRVNPYALIYNGIKNSYSADDLKAGLTPIVGKACKVSRLYVERKELFEFPEEDLADAELLREFRLPQEFTRHAKGGATASMMMLLTLLFCGMLELEEAEFAVPIKGRGAKRSRPAARQPAPGDGRPSQPAGESMSAATRQQAASKITDELVQKINDKYDQVKDADHYGVLEVEKDADTETIKKTFLVLAKVYHPDRIAGSDDEGLQHRVSVVAGKINEAYAILSDPFRRADYDQTGGTAGVRGKAREGDANVQFQKCLVYIKKKDLKSAAECIRWAVDLDPKNGDYQAYRIWIEYLRNESGTEHERAAEAKADLLAVAKRDRDSFWAARFLANLYNKLDDMDNYGRALAMAHKLDRHDVETARELRLYRLRKEKTDSRGKFLGIKFRK